MLWPVRWLVLGGQPELMLFKRGGGTGLSSAATVPGRWPVRWLYK
jgi:hypothetical protein